jgi:hypothetical protein
MTRVTTLRRGTRAAIALASAACAISAFPARTLAAGSLTVTTCGANVFAHHAVFGINTTIYCPPGTNIPPGMTIAPGPNTVPAGQRASWEADAPAGLAITGASIAPYQMYSIHINDGQSWGGGFYWAGGGAETFDNTTQLNVSGLNSSYFGFQVICGWSTCDGNTHPAQFTVESINLYATETQGPWLAAPSGLWQASGWIRGAWTLEFWGDSPSGLCSESATLNGQSIPGASSTVDPTVWHQCAAPPVVQSILTGNYGQGGEPLTIRATDAAGVSTTDSSYTKTIYIDNSLPVVSFSGPSDAPVTAGTQYVTATASGSPSGIDGLTCSLDGGPNQWYAGSSAQIAVSGIGDHTIRCAAANNAVDGAGNHGWSTWASWSLRIREPTVSTIGFARLVDALRCHRVREQVTVPAHWVTVRRHHKPVRVKRPAHSKVVTATRCHARVVWRRITVWTTVLRHGKPVRVKRHRRIRIVEVPHVVYHTSKRVGHGKGTSVSGWLGMPGGTALGGQAVHVLTAPDNGLGQFSQAAAAVTRADGTWSARLPAGPSRLVEAYYGGAPTLEPSQSSQVHVVVRAKVKLIGVSPTRVAWGGMVRIVGKLEGGYLPPGGALVRLRIGFGSGYTTYGVQEHVTGNGRFSTTYTFGLGDPSIYRSYWFQIASLPMGDYPWAPAASGKLSVLVGGHPAVPRPPAHHRQKHRQHHRHHKR